MCLCVCVCVYLCVFIYPHIHLHLDDGAQGERGAAFLDRVQAALVHGGMDEGAEDVFGVDAPVPLFEGLALGRRLDRLVLLLLVLLAPVTEASRIYI